VKAGGIGLKSIGWTPNPATIVDTGVNDPSTGMPKELWPIEPSPNEVLNSKQAPIDIVPNRIILGYNPNSSILPKTPIEHVRKFPIKNGLPQQLDQEDTTWKPQIVPKVSVSSPIELSMKPVKGWKRKKLKPISIMSGIEPYDLLVDLGKLKANISIQQLLGVAPQCHSLLQSSLIRKRMRLIVNEVSLSPDTGTPTIDVQIDGIIIQGVQVDGGSSVNLMNVDTILSLQLTNLQETKLILRMVDQSRVKPLGILPKVSTVISGLVYAIDFLFFQPNTPNVSYPLLLG